MIRMVTALATAGFVAAGVYGVAERHEAGSMAPPEPASAVLPAAYPVDRPAPQQSLDPQLAQPRGTVCETPDGRICTVAPQPLNSRCQCGQSYGRIVR